MLTPQRQELTADQQSKASALFQKVRDATERFKDVAQAEREHYALLFGCVSGTDTVANGAHFLNGDLLNGVNNGGVFDPTRRSALNQTSGCGRPSITGN